MNEPTYYYQTNLILSAGPDKPIIESFNGIRMLLDSVEKCYFIGTNLMFYQDIKKNIAELASITVIFAKMVQRVVRKIETLLQLFDDNKMTSTQCISKINIKLTKLKYESEMVQTLKTKLQDAHSKTKELGKYLTEELNKSERTKTWAQLILATLCSIVSLIDKIGFNLNKFTFIENILTKHTDNVLNRKQDIMVTNKSLMLLLKAMEEFRIGLSDFEIDEDFVDLSEDSQLHLFKSNVEGMMKECSALIDAANQLFENAIKQPETPSSCFIL